MVSFKDRCLRAGSAGAQGSASCCGAVKRRRVPHFVRHGCRTGCLFAGSLLLAGCPGAPREAAPPSAPADAHALIERSIPLSVSDRAAWASDIYNAFIALTVAPTRENACAVVAVIEQESGFHVDPVIPGLGAIARGEIALRAEHAHVPMMIVNGVLQLKS